MRVAGANIERGKVYVCALETGAGPLGDAISRANARFEMDSGLMEAEALVDLSDRVRQHLEPLAPDRVLLTEVRKYNQWAYKDAYAHVMAIAAINLACHQLGIPFATVKTGDVGRAVEVDAAALKTFDSERVGYAQPPTYWTAGLGPAHAAAAFGLTEMADG